MFREGCRRIAVLVTVLWLGGIGLAGAQGARDLKLNLKSERPPAPRMAPLAEFKISLDSQMLTRETPSPAEATQLQLSSERPPSGERELVLRSSKFDESATPAKPRESSDRPSVPPAQTGREFGSTLTLTPGYLEGGRYPRSANTRFISGSREGDRWRFYGEVGQEPGIGFGGNPGTSLSLGERPSPPRSLSSLRTEGDLAVATSDQPRGFMLNNYYLEAMYKFRPAVQGKVSYEKSLVDSLEANENLQLEGIVETGKDVTIKAGYRNQFSPEAKQRRSVGDQKVWTEFILKF